MVAIFSYDGDGDGPVLDVARYVTLDLLMSAAADPSWRGVLAEAAQANHARTGVWHIGAVPDDAPGGPTGWDALAAEAQARFEATGHWGLLSYDAARRVGHPLGAQTRLQAA